MFSDLPFTKVKCIKWKKEHPYHAYYKTSFSDENVIEVTKLTKKQVLSNEKKVRFEKYA